MGKQGFLGEFEHVVLLTLVRLEGRAHGRAIHEEIESRGLAPVAVTAVYVTLSRMEDKGYLSSYQDAPEGGRTRKHFRIEEPGLEALRRSREQLDRFWEGVEVGAGEGR